ncbi:hypothetical protein ABE205_12070, partial [Brevibacillus agri]|uniref:hypothetical protein n=1 Tax=Brevibacillus agri TaxID=51101 RepID=UPI003D253D98
SVFKEHFRLRPLSGADLHLIMSTYQSQELFLGDIYFCSLALNLAIASGLLIYHVHFVISRAFLKTH